MRWCYSNKTGLPLLVSLPRCLYPLKMPLDLTREQGCERRARSKHSINKTPHQTSTITFSMENKFEDDAFKQMRSDRFEGRVLEIPLGSKCYSMLSCIVSVPSRLTVTLEPDSSSLTFMTLVFDLFVGGARSSCLSLIHLGLLSLKKST